MNGPLVFTGNRLLRPDAERRDEAWLAAQRAHPAGRYLALRNLEAPVMPGESPRLGWLDGGSVAPDAGEVILLGLLDGVPHFAVAAEEANVGALETAFTEPRSIAPLLPTEEAAMLAQARSLLDWHARHRFCAQCGQPTVFIEGGARRACRGCNARHYPRVDPSIIVVVEHEGRILLAQRSAAAGTRRSCLAGFLEPGESIEEAVVREVFEETHVEVERVRYEYSQPWPFPSALMIGCRAQARGDEVVVDGVEIASAEWFTPDEVRRALAGESDALSLPGPIAIAHHLIRDWAMTEP